MKQARIEIKHHDTHSKIVFALTHTDKHGSMDFNEITIAQSDDGDGLTEVFQKLMEYNTIDTNENPQWNPKPQGISEAKLFINATAYALGVRLTAMQKKKDENGAK